MPLETGSGKAVVSHNISVERKAGRPEKQAIAIAFSKAGEARDDAEAHLSRHASLIRPNLHAGLHQTVWDNSNRWPKVPGHKA